MFGNFSKLWKRFLTGLELFPSFENISKWIRKSFCATGRRPPPQVPPPCTQPESIIIYYSFILMLTDLIKSHNYQSLPPDGINWADNMLGSFRIQEERQFWGKAKVRPNATLPLVRAELEYLTCQMLLKFYLNDDYFLIQ